MYNSATPSPKTFSVSVRMSDDAERDANSSSECQCTAPTRCTSKEGSEIQSTFSLQRGRVHSKLNTTKSSAEQTVVYQVYATVKLNSQLALTAFHVTRCMSACLFLRSSRFQMSESLTKGLRITTENGEPLCFNVIMAREGKK